MSEYETSFPPSNPVIATVVCTEEGAVRAGDVVGLTEEEVKRPRVKRPREEELMQAIPGFTEEEAKRPRKEELMQVTLGIQQEFQQVAGVVWADTSVDVGTKIAVAVAGAITIRSEGHEGVRPGDYIVASPNKRFKTFTPNAVYEPSPEQLLNRALKKVDKNELFIDWVQKPFHDPALNFRYNRALQKLFGVKGDLVPPNRITRLFGYNDRGEWEYADKMGKAVVIVEVKDNNAAIKNVTFGPIIDGKLGYERERSGQPVWGSEENGNKLTEAFVEGGLEIDKIPSAQNRKESLVEKRMLLNILAKIAAAKLWALMPTDDLNVLYDTLQKRINTIFESDESDDNEAESDFFTKPLGEFFQGLEMDETVQFSARPFGKCLEVGEGVLRVLLIHNSP